MLKADNIKKSFNGEEVLVSAGLSAAPGRILCIAGKNASGKTTLLSILCGLLAPDSGSVEAGGGVALVPQQPALLEALSVSDNLRLWYASRGRRGPLWLPDSPETLLGMAQQRKKRAGALSSGMKKRLSIACALACRPLFLLLDEPFAALDTAACLELEQLLLSLRQNGLGIIFTSHQPEHIAALADELLILKDGVLHKTPTLPERSLTDAAARVAGFLNQSLY